MIRLFLSRAVVAGVVTVLAPGFVGDAHADQKDERLPALFGQLKDAPTSDAAAEIERRIWGIWIEAGDPEIDQLMAVGSAAMSAREFPAALSAFNRIVEKRPDFAEGWNRRATLYYLMGEYQKSLDDIDRTLALEPRHFGAMSGLGLVNLELDREAEAAKAYRRFLEIDPRNESARKNLDAIDAILMRKSI
jgi:tetratricopeptide (TPR) repeat protein